MLHGDRVTRSPISAHGYADPVSPVIWVRVDSPAATYDRAPGVLDRALDHRVSCPCGRVAAARSRCARLVRHTLEYVRRRGRGNRGARTQKSQQGLPLRSELARGFEPCIGRRAGPTNSVMRFTRTARRNTATLAVPLQL